MVITSCTQSFTEILAEYMMPLSIGMVCVLLGFCVYLFYKIVIKKEEFN